MLKLWKQAWRREDPSVIRQQDPGQDDDQSVHPNGSGIEESTSASPLPASVTGDTNSVAVSSEAVVEGPTGTKRHTSDVSDDTSMGDGPAPKRYKQSVDAVEDADGADDAPEIEDTIRNHLPEIFGTEEAHDTGVAISSPQDILNEAKCGNVIALLRNYHDVLSLTRDHLQWALDNAKSSQTSRIALFLVEGESLETQPHVYARSLAASTNLRIESYSSSGDEDTQASNTWQDALTLDVVVLSPMHLLELLRTGIVDLSQLHTIYLRDARPIKDNDLHPMNRLMADFYMPAEENLRPRIVACIPEHLPFDARMLKLEQILCSKVCGVSDDIREYILAMPDRPTELVVFYERASKYSYTLLYRQLRKIDPDESIFPRLFSAARHTLVEVGPAASDLVWRRALPEIEMTSAVNDDDEEEDEILSPEAEAALRIRDTIKNWVFAMPNLDPSSRGFNVMPKFLKLVHVLRSCRAYGDAFRGIVFVQRRAVALVMVDLLRTLDMGYLRPHALVGHGNYGPLQSETEIIQAFGMGTYNLLIATKCGEDIDLPRASLVVRYDLFESQVSYGYSRARTRGRESHLVHMIQRGNDTHRRMLTHLTQLSTPMHLWAEKVAAGPEGAVPPTILHETHDPYLSDSEDEDEPDGYIKDPTTSGRIRLQDATSVVYQVAASARGVTTDAVEYQPLFVFEEVATNSAYPRVVCTVTLPEGPAIRTFRGSPSSSFSQARRTACFETCSGLFHAGLLDYHYFPQPPRASSPYRRRPDESDTLELDEVGSASSLPPKGSAHNKQNGTRCYPRKRPDFWTNSLQAGLTRLYPTIISVEISSASSSAAGVHGPIVLLTRLPLPSVASFKLFSSGVPAIAHLRRGAAMEVDDARLQDLHLYTIRICRAILNKHFVAPLEKMPYFFAPISPSWPGFSGPVDNRWHRAEVMGGILWTQVSIAARDWVVPLQTASVHTLSDDLQDAIIQDRWVEFTRRHFVVRIRPDLTPMSKPVDSPREEGYDNFVEYCKEHRKNFQGLRNYGQPLIEVGRVGVVMNVLNPVTKQSTPPTKPDVKYLIPELCCKFTIAASTFRTALLLPSITRRIEDLLLVKELNASFFDHSISEYHLHAAISAPSASVEFDYERLELLGDAYLKYLSSIYLFVTNPSQHEGALHSARLRIISNKALLHNADAAGLPPFVQAKTFVAKFWQPPYFEVLPIPSAAGNRKDEALEERDRDGGGAAGATDGQYSPFVPVTAAGVKEERATPVGELHRYSTSASPSTREQTSRQRSTSYDVTMIPQNIAPALIRDLSMDAPGSKPSGSELGREVPGAKQKRLQDEQGIHWLGDKTVADVAEAIVGAAYVTGGREAALKASKALCIAVPRVDRWSDFGRKALAPPPDVTARLRAGSIEAVEAILGHKFERPHLLAQALTHGSIQGYEITSYERLEFIGDAILDFMVIRHVYDRDTKLSPGAMTLLKGAMVSNSALAAVCIWAGLDEYLMFEAPVLAHNIRAYAQKLREKQKEEYALAQQEGRSPGQYWLETEPPKALSDVVESIIGATYISDNFSPVGVEKVFDKILKPFYDKHITLQTLSHHPTKILFELFQAQGCSQFEIIRRIQTDGLRQTAQCDVIVHDVILASAEDNTSALAAKRVSLCALDALEGDPEFMRYTCDCRALSQAKKAQKKAQAQSQQVQAMLVGFSKEEEKELMAMESAVQQDDRLKDRSPDQDEDEDEDEKESSSRSES